LCKTTVIKEEQVKVLVITYYFPPSGGAGVQRTLKFVKYLRDFGWEPVVLTAANADYPIHDESLFAEIPPGTKVYRSKIIEPYKIYRLFTGKRSGESADIATLSLDEQSKKKLSERMAEWMRATFFVPDARIGWRRFARQMGKKIIGREGIDLIYSSAPPYTAHLIGLDLHKRSGIPWVADFRDSWIGWLSTPQWRPKPCRRIELNMEESVLKHANKILAVSDGVKQDLLSRHAEYNDDRWVLLSNGYDQSDFKEIVPASKPPKLTITYTGSIYGNRNPEYLIRALERMQEKHEDVTRLFHIRLVGRVGDPIKKRICKSSVRDIFEIIPYVTHQESLAYLLATDISLLIIDDAPVNRGILTGKLFEYIGAGRPILALAPDGDAARLIRKHELGLVVPPKDVQAIQAALTDLLSRYRRNQLTSPISAEIRRQFERRYLTERLAKIFDEMIGASAPAE
jgi:glycosyltransferase involved in cell wall biosynthesis